MSELGEPSGGLPLVAFPYPSRLASVAIEVVLARQVLMWSSTYSPAQCSCRHLWRHACAKEGRLCASYRASLDKEGSFLC